jgi:hypothetical protein
MEGGKKMKVYIVKSYIINDCDSCPPDIERVFFDEEDAKAMCERFSHMFYDAHPVEELDRDAIKSGYISTREVQR